MTPAPKPVHPVDEFANPQGRPDRLPPHTCGKCPARWWGLRMAHCRSCHRTFTTPANFDLHRVGPVDDRACDVEQKDKKGLLKLIQLRPEVWGRPGQEVSDSTTPSGGNRVA